MDNTDKSTDNLKYHLSHSVHDPDPLAQVLLQRGGPIRSSFVQRVRCRLRVESQDQALTGEWIQCCPESLMQSLTYDDCLCVNINTWHIWTYRWHQAQVWMKIENVSISSGLQCMCGRDSGLLNQKEGAVIWIYCGFERSDEQQNQHSCVLRDL